tara:strand:- start:21477 stop:21677 length:201 start_codon:yes stop_codon:yes gene_type:complete
MKNHERLEILKFAILINLVIGLYNMLIYAYANSLFNLVIGSLNIGVWVFFRDMKLVNVLLKRKHKL